MSFRKIRAKIPLICQPNPCLMNSSSKCLLGGLGANLEPRPHLAIEEYNGCLVRNFTGPLYQCASWGPPALGFWEVDRNLGLGPSSVCIHVFSLRLFSSLSLRRVPCSACLLFGLMCELLTLPPRQSQNFE